MSYRNYLLAVVAVIVALNAAEQLALGLVLQDLKHDFLLTDTQLGLLTGFAFALFYAVAGLALARWADRGNRIVIISLTTIAWGVLLAAFGRATTFLQLVLLRVGIGVGEAGSVPVAQSLIADYFDRAERVRAMAVYFATVAGVAQIVGYVVAGQLNEVYHWRVMFMVLGLPGLAIAIVAWFTLREPRTGSLRKRPVARGFGSAHASSPTATAGAPAPLGLNEALVTLWSNTTLRHLMLFWAVWGFTNFGLLRWSPAFFVRSYGLHTGELGIWFACVYGVTGTLGPLLGGAWCSRYAARNEALQLKAMAVTCCGLLIISPFIYLVHDYRLAFGFLGVTGLLSMVFIGTFFAIVTTVVQHGLRASATAVLMLIGSLVGQGFGPLVTGALSDALRAQLGQESLPYASLAMCPGFLWAAWHLWRASRSVSADLPDTQEDRSDESVPSDRVSPEIGC
jgi:MFS family permease